MDMIGRIGRAVELQCSLPPSFTARNLTAKSGTDLKGNIDHVTRLFELL